MTQNDKIILNQVLEENRIGVAPTLSEADYFEIFSAEQVLKDYDLSFDEIESGIVAGGGDGGIDSWYTFVNGELLQKDSDFSYLRKDIVIEVVIMQSKTTDGFSETAVEKLTSTSNELLDLSKPISVFQKTYNAELLENVALFRNTFQGFASKFPKLTFSYFFAAKGDDVNHNVLRKVENLKTVIKTHFSAAEFSFEFLTAAKLLELARRRPTSTYELRLTESLSASEGVAFMCLVSLADFQKFITDSNGKLIRHIFEANVRDYQGRTEVNEQIQNSLEESAGEDFWWLNNGITVLATNATQSGKTLTIENPEIVNGLQTSTEIYNYFSSKKPSAEKRNLLVRVIEPKQPESRDRIIRATNSQTSIPSASLRATDLIHRNIEQYLKSFGLYYDRRKNYYKNEGKPISRIISIAQLAQAIEAIALRRPDTARARPSSLIKNDDDYQKLFNVEYPIEIYRFSIDLLKSTESYLADHKDSLPSATRNDIKFYVAMAASQLMLNKIEPSVKEMADLAGKSIPDSILEKSYNLVNYEYRNLGGSDQAAKGTDLLQALLTVLPSHL